MARCTLPWKHVWITKVDGSGRQYIGCRNCDAVKQ